MVAGFIRKQRSRLDMTQEEVALEMGLTRQTYAQIESGKRDITLSEAEKLASVFGMSLRDFVDRKEVGREVILEEDGAEYKTEDLQIRVQSEDIEKFRQVLLYVLCAVGGKPNVGETVLHKLLYFIDFDYYEKYEENLMGVTYIKNRHGPTAVVFGKIVERMIEAKEIEKVKSPYFKYSQKKYLALKRPDLTALSAQEKEHIDGVLARLSDKNAKEIEEYSHGDLPWKVARHGEEILYEVVFYRGYAYSVRDYEDEL